MAKQRKPGRSSKHVQKKKIEIRDLPKLQEPLTPDQTQKIKGGAVGPCNITRTKT
jgi:hypothetical protein